MNIKEESLTSNLLVVDVIFKVFSQCLLKEDQKKQNLFLKETKWINRMKSQKISKKEKDLILLSFALFLLFIVSATIDYFTFIDTLFFKQYEFTSIHKYFQGSSQLILRMRKILTKTL